MLVLQGLLLLPPPPQLPLLPCFCWTQARSLQAAMKRRRQPEAVPRHSWESAAPSWEADALFESSASEMEMNNPTINTAEAVVLGHRFKGGMSQLYVYVVGKCYSQRNIEHTHFVGHPGE